MTENKDLFKYELGLVAILKDEAPYQKEWLEYHLLAGVDHFYIYNNDDDETILKKVLQPYIDKGLVDYIVFPGKRPQMAAYQDAVQKFKYECRYMTFLDGDEFIYPMSNNSIMEVVNKILDKDPLAEGLSINWQCFGTSGLEKADYSKGVLERFLYRATNERDFEKTGKIIVNPRCIKDFTTPHYVGYFDGQYSVNEKGVPSAFSEPVSAEKIVINHYHFKSLEEYSIKKQRGSAYNEASVRLKAINNCLENSDRYNEIYDDGILQYKKSRQKKNKENIGGGGQLLTQINQRRFTALIRILSPIAIFADLSPAMLQVGLKNTSKATLEDFMTCWAVSKSLKAEGFLSEIDSKALEELSLKFVLASLSNENIQIWQIEFLIEELPEILKLNYSVVDQIKESIIKLIPHLKDFKRENMIDWIGYKNLNYVLRMLQI